MQQAMQFKDFVWPNNPTRFRASYRRRTAVLEHPGAMWQVQELGTQARTFSGEGIFFGENAYETFRRLAMLFYQGGAGVLSHPQWQDALVYLTELELEQEPRENFLRYRFVFVEAPEDAP